MLNRVLDLLRSSHQVELARAAAHAAGVALTSAPQALTGKGAPSFGALQELVRACDAGAGAAGGGAAMLAAPLRLLLDDLQSLCANRA